MPPRLLLIRSRALRVMLTLPFRPSFAPLRRAELPMMAPLLFQFTMPGTARSRHAARVTAQYAPVPGARAAVTITGRRAGRILFPSPKRYENFVR